MALSSSCTTLSTNFFSLRRRRYFLRKTIPTKMPMIPAKMAPPTQGGPAFLPDEPGVEPGKDGQQENDEHYLEYLLYHVKSPGR